MPGDTRRRLHAWARRLRAEALTLWFAARHERTPWPVRLLAAAVAVYAFSPLDLIPDVIPVLGLLDDLVLVPLGLWAVVRLVPPGVWAECRERAAAAVERPVSRAAAVVVVVLWAGAAAATAWALVLWGRS